MLRPVLLALAASLVTCSPARNVATTGAVSTASSAPSQYEPAPVVTPVDFNLPPDLRDKVCGDVHDQGGSYATITKSDNSFCR